MMKHLGIVCAIKREAEDIIKLYEMSVVKSVPYSIYQGRDEYSDVTLIICGLGKVVAAMASQELIASYRVDEIINIGICGALSDKLRIGNVVYSNQFVQHDYHIDEPDKHDLWIPSIESHLIETKKPTLFETVERSTGIFRGIMCSGDSFINNRDIKVTLAQSTGGITCDMESAAIAQVCYLLGCPFMSIRSISDVAEEIPSDFSVNMATALKQVSSVFIDARRTLIALHNKCFRF